MSLTMKEMTRISLNNHSSPRILFPTGTTPLGADGFFAKLISARQNENLPTERIRMVSGDEYYGVAIEDPGSFATYLRKNVVEPLGMDPKSSLLLNGTAPHPATHCSAFEESLRNDPCSMAVLGLGTNGHVAFNDPPSSATSSTRRLRLTQGSVQASKQDFPDRSKDNLPTEALSVGLGTLTSHSRVCCVLVTGKRKAAIVCKVLEADQPITPAVPASALRSASNFVFCLDEAAAQDLSTTTLQRTTKCQNLTPTEAAGLLFAQTSQTIISGDVGGTNARMQLWDVLGSGMTLLRCDRRYLSSNFTNGEQLIENFLNVASLHHPSEQIDALCLAICGPVSNETVQAGVVLPEQGPTGWGLDMRQVLSSSKIGSRVRKAKLINDFVAVGLGVTGIDASSVVTLHSATLGCDSMGTKAAVGAGTGLGAVFMTYDTHGEKYVAYPSEGGMAEFAAQTDRQWALRSFLKEALGGYCTVESVVSGPGLVNVFHFCNASREAPSLMLDGVSRKECPAKIMEGVKNNDATSKECLDLWLECLACHLRLTAMQMLPTGGLYICGGIACRPLVLERIKDLMSPGMFVEDKVMGNFLKERISLHVIVDDDCGLLGARIRAERLLLQ